MDQESEKLLRQTFKLAKENNKVLHKMRRAQKLASFLRVVYWLIILGVGVGIYYFLQPMIQSITESISSIKESIPF